MKEDNDGNIQFEKYGEVEVLRKGKFVPVLN
jgi:hypothetical protein